MEMSSYHELILSDPIVEEALPQDLNALEDLILAVSPSCVTSPFDSHSKL
jgi:hypothetical protein